VSDHYDKLTEAEAAHWDEYTRLRELSDWEGFDAAQDARRQRARDWLVNQRKYIWRCANGSVPDVEAGWDLNNRSERYAQLKDTMLNVGTCRRLCQLPTGGGTPSEKSYISEREMWWRVNGTDAAQSAARQACTDWLVARRKEVWHLGEDEGWGEAERAARYDNLCVATRHGTPFEDWSKDHNTTTGAPIDTTSGTRGECVAWHHDHEGITENPANSNSDNREDGIRTSQTLTADGGSWLHGEPWCGCWAYSGLHAAGVVGLGSWMASVASIESYARAGSGPFRGWRSGFTTDCQRGDLVVIGGTGVHVETITETPDPGDGYLVTNGGNTSSGSSGSQSNGGGAYRRQRYPGEVTGVALVDFPG
jgi:hypothetical protein